jgi:outer membrane lipoprotein-sorting protein
MKRLLFLIALSAFSFQSYSQDVDVIVENHIKALGGADKWANVKSMKMTGSMELGPNMKAPFTIYLKGRNKVRFELEFQGMKMIQALNGDSGWAVSPFMGKTDPERMSEEDVRSSKEQADFTPELFDYKVKGSIIESLGKEDMEGTETIKLKVTKKNGDVKYMYLDSSTFLVLKETSRQKFEDKEVEAVSIPSDYRSISGIMVPFNMEMRADEESTQGQSMVFESVEFNPAVDDALFAFPASEKK